MIFNSLPFVVLVVVTLALYFQLRSASRQVTLLLAASFVFYGWSSPTLLLLLMASAAINGITSYLAIKQNQKAIHWLWLGVVTNLLILAAFKYPKLIFESITGVVGTEALSGFDFMLTIPLPIGISFYTFQGISLLVDAYAGDIPSQEGKSLRQHLAETIFFISFFPQLVAGPIVKSKEFLPQIKTKTWADVDGIFACKAIILGYFLKMYVADNLVNSTLHMNNAAVITQEGTVTLALYLVAYSMQIFADFAGYSSVAIGIAALFGYRLAPNFNNPFISRNMSEYWTRWHISLSSWLRDYLFLPLALRSMRKGRGGAFALIATMFLGGLWHGASWNYAVWGLWHGVLLVLGYLSAKYLRFYKPDILTIPIVFACVTASWTVFSIADYQTTITYWQSMFSNTHILPKAADFFYVAAFSCPVVLLHVVGYIKENHAGFANKFSYGIAQTTEQLLYSGMLFLVTLNPGVGQDFIYFQF